MWDEKGQRHIYEVEFIRIIYQNTGEAAVNPTDVDNNAIPDQVEDIAKQLWAAHRVFCVLYGFTEPLRSQRYPEARYIEVFMRSKEKMTSQETGKASRGFAFQRAQRALLSNNKAQALIIALIHTLDPKKNSTPTHELFHLVQNASTHITTGWYFEGMARWSQDSLHVTDKRAVANTHILMQLHEPQTVESLNALSYDAAWSLWYPLAFALDPDPPMQLSENDPLLTLTYSDGSRVLQDKKFPGAHFMRLVIKHLHSIQRDIEAEPSFTSWKERRRDPTNTPYALEAIQRARHELQKGTPYEELR